MASVDVVVPCYCYGHFLRDCVASVLSQGIRDIRVLIIDDASPDNSADIALQLAKEDRRVEIVAHGTNKGHIATYNEGIDWAKADYFLLLSADDLLAPGSLSRAVSIMERRPDVSFTHGDEVDFISGEAPPAIEDNAQEARWDISLGRQIIEQMCRLMFNDIRTSTVVARTAAQKMVGHYRSELPHSGDLEMWLRLATIGAVAKTTAVQGIRRRHGSNMSNYYLDVKLRDFSQRQAAVESFFANEGRSMPGATHLHRRAKRSLAEQAYWSGLKRIYLGKIQQGLVLLKFAYRLSPTIVFLPPIGYVMRSKSSLARIADVIAQSLAGKHEAHAP